MTPRRGFTLVELLVVISIIGVLVALLLPAVDAAREQGRLTTCKNNLHQLGLACQQHVDKLGFFPSGGWGSNWVGLPDQGSGASQPGGWIYQLLPYMDQAALHDLGKGTFQGSQTPQNADPKLISTPVSGLYCPTRRTGKAYPLSTGGVAGRTDYAANGGSVYIPIGSGSSPTSAPAPATFAWPNLTALGFNGIVAIHSQIGLAEVKDSKDTTYLFGEKYMRPEYYTNGQDQGDKFSAMSGDDLSTIRWASSSAMMDRSGFDNQQSYGSAHSAGWNVAFVAGNVQLMNWNLDGATHTAMSTRNGHEVIDPAKIGM